MGADRGVCDEGSLSSLRVHIAPGDYDVPSAARLLHNVSLVGAVRRAALEKLLGAFFFGASAVSSCLAPGAPGLVLRRGSLDRDANPYEPTNSELCTVVIAGHSMYPEGHVAFSTRSNQRALRRRTVESFFAPG